MKDFPSSRSSQSLCRDDTPFPRGECVVRLVHFDEVSVFTSLVPLFNKNQYTYVYLFENFFRNDHNIQSKVPDSTSNNTFLLYKKRGYKITSLRETSLLHSVYPLLLIRSDTRVDLRVKSDYGVLRDRVELWSVTGKHGVYQ